MRLAISLALGAALASAGCADRQQHRHYHYGHYHGYQYQQPSRPNGGAPPVQEARFAPQAEEPSGTGASPVVRIAAGDEADETGRVQQASTGDFGHAEDYSWLVGYLHRVHMPDARWKVRYAPLSQADEWGGSMVLAPDIRLEDYQEGDVVYIEGELLAARPSLYVAGPLYRIRHIRPYRQELELAVPAAESSGTARAPVADTVTPAAYPQSEPVVPVAQEDDTPVDPQYGPPIPDCHAVHAQPPSAYRGYYYQRGGRYYRVVYPPRGR